jgi:hypothetical protein
MTNVEIYKLASELTEKQVENTLLYWNEINDKKTLDLFNSLVRLGDSKELALSTSIAERYKRIENESHNEELYLKQL